jgi:succinate dehydrogenase/fumarate reductase flavoprotein subunit
MERVVVIGGGFAGFWSAVDAYLPVAAESDSGSARLSSSICISAEAVLGEVKHARHPF